MQAQRITATVKGFEDHGPLTCVIPFPDDVMVEDDGLLPLFEAALRQTTNTDRRSPTPLYYITKRETIDWDEFMTQSVGSDN